jgi:hypothetical protein
MNKKIFRVIFGLVFTLSFGGMVILKQYYAFERPLSPQLELGRVIPVLANYNKTVFVTSEEKHWIYLTYLGMAVGGIACAILVFIPSKRST